MKISLAILLSAATTSVVAQSFGTKWNDPYIPQPKNFVVQNANAQCDFQIAYDRFLFDNRYDVQYIAEYADGNRRQLNGISGSLPRDNVWFLDTNWQTSEYGIQAVFFRDACRNGVAPRTFRVNFALRSGYTYQNRYTTGSFSISSGQLPAAPTNVRVTTGRSSTVSWSPVQGATGYVALVEYLVDSEVGPIPFVYALEVGAGATSASYNRRFTRAAVIAIGDGLASSGAKRFTALDDVVDVRPT